MLRVGLTGDLGSGKSTVAQMLRERGAVVMASDDIARELMEPGQCVYDAIVQHFGSGVVENDSRLDRAELARLAFDPQFRRVEELNAIVHPAVIAEQERRVRQLEAECPESIVVVESALVFSARGQDRSASGLSEQYPWWRRFDCIVLVTAPHEVKLARAMERSLQADTSAEERERLRADAERRLQVQSEVPVPASDSILTLRNSGDLQELASRVETLWAELQRRAALR